VESRLRFRRLRAIGLLDLRSRARADCRGKTKGTNDAGGKWPPGPVHGPGACGSLRFRRSHARQAVVHDRRSASLDLTLSPRAWACLLRPNRSGRSLPVPVPGYKRRRAPPFPKAPFMRDGDKPNSVAPKSFGAWMIIYLIRPAKTERTPVVPTAIGDRGRNVTWCDDTRGSSRTGCPSSVLSCTAWGFSCLADLSASGELLPRLFTLACSSGKLAAPLNSFLSKNRRFFLCDTFRRRNLSTAAPASSTRHAAVWCSDFPPANLAIHRRSSAINAYFSTIRAA
jgi:hypothetical protein